MDATNKNLLHISRDIDIRFYDSGHAAILDTDTEDGITLTPLELIRLQRILEKHHSKPTAPEASWIPERQ
jgi:hypothetical protein